MGEKFANLQLTTLETETTEVQPESKNSLRAKLKEEQAARSKAEASVIALRSQVEQMKQINSSLMNRLSQAAVKAHESDSLLDTGVKEKHDERKAAEMRGICHALSISVRERAKGGLDDVLRLREGIEEMNKALLDLERSCQEAAEDVQAERKLRTSLMDEEEEIVDLSQALRKRDRELKRKAAGLEEEARRMAAEAEELRQKIEAENQRQLAAAEVLRELQEACAREHQNYEEEKARADEEAEKVRLLEESLDSVRESYNVRNEEASTAEEQLDRTKRILEDVSIVADLCPKLAQEVDQLKTVNEALMKQMEEQQKQNKTSTPKKKSRFSLPGF